MIFPFINFLLNDLNLVTKLGGTAYQAFEVLGNRSNEIGGKTGTAMIVNKKGGYFKDRDLTSFIGIFPINDPKYVVLTIIEYPKVIKEINNKTTGAWINAPLVKDIILRIIDILKIPKKIPKEILNADIKHIYKTHNVSF